jgi:hypothetical protein
LKRLLIHHYLKDWFVENPDKSASNQQIAKFAIHADATFTDVSRIRSFLPRMDPRAGTLLLQRVVSAVADILLVTVGPVPSGLTFALAHGFAIAAYSTTRDIKNSLLRMLSRCGTVRYRHQPNASTARASVRLNCGPQQ